MFWKSTFANFLSSSLSDEQRALVEPDLLALYKAGRGLALADYQLALHQRAEIAVAAKAFFNAYDLLLSPVMPIRPFAANRLGPPGIARDDWSWCPFTWIFNLTRQPAASVPCGFTADGLPMGLHIFGPLYGDTLVLRGGRAFEHARPMHDRHPVPA